MPATVHADLEPRRPGPPATPSSSRQQLTQATDEGSDQGHADPGASPGAVFRSQESEEHSGPPPQASRTRGQPGEIPEGLRYTLTGEYERVEGVVTSKGKEGTMDTPTRAKAQTVYHSAELVEATAAEPVDRAKLRMLSQLAAIRPADERDETMLALIHNMIQMGQGE